MDKDYILSVAETIRQQLVALTPPDVLLSWGISRLVATTCEDMPALRFHVNGRIFQGFVYIVYDEGADYYEVHLQNKDGRKKVAEDIDFESLGSTIDRLVEKGEDEAEYNAFCEQERRKLFMGQI